MKIILNTPRAFTEQGMKANQEDRVMPQPIERMPRSTRCFVLCDGMGGHEHGEVAAEIVSRSLYDSLMAGVTDPDIITPDRFKAALAATYKALDQMPVGEGKRPGTTMTCLYFAENAVLAAHIGDSRIYQVRPGAGIIFKTRDHSLVNDLLRAGELTEEEARNFPQKNVITRAMQPGLERPYRADISMLTDVRPGDFFFMCCDGILEQLTDERLVEIIEADTDPQVKREQIYDVCFNRTRDNFTCILVPVEDVEGAPLPTPEPKPAGEPITAVVELPDADVAPRSGTKGGNIGSALREANDRADKRHRAIIIGAIAFIAVVAIALLFFLLSPKETPKDSKPAATKPTTENSVDKGKNDEGKGRVDEPEPPIDEPADELTDETKIQLASDRIELIDTPDPQATPPMAQPTPPAPDQQNPDGQAAEKIEETLQKAKATKATAGVPTGRSATKHNQGTKP